MATTAAAAAANSAQAGDNISWVALLVVILVVLASIVVGLRIYTRSQILNHLDWDDYCVIFTLVGCLLFMMPSRSLEDFEDSCAYLFQNQAIAIGNGAILLSCMSRSNTPSNYSLPSSTEHRRLIPIGIRYGLGRHTTELGLFEVTEYLRVSVCSQYNPILYSGKKTN